jgi:protein TonB
MSSVTFFGAPSEDVMTDAPAWRAGTVFAIALHAGLAAAIVFAHIGRTPPPDAASAITIDLAPMVSAPPEPEAALPEGPKEEETPPEEEVVPEPEPDPLPEPPRETKAEVALPKPVEKPKKQPVKEMTAPSAVEMPPAETTAAPVNAAPRMANTTAMPTYEHAILTHLERHKKYPRSARRRGQEGTAYVRFRLDRQGNVLSSELAKSSGHDILDQEVLDTMRRANPLPPMPPEIAGATISVTVPVRFFRVD